MTDMGRKKYNPNDTLLTHFHGPFYDSKQNIWKYLDFIVINQFKNWFIDDWISEIYDKFNKKLMILNL